MSHISKDSKLVKCPFFQGIDKDRFRIHCEGFVPNSKNILEFDSKGEQDQYKIRFCYNAYRYCRVYFLNDAKYDETGELKP